MKGIKGMTSLLAAFIMCLGTAQAATLAIIDSGTDMKHIEIADFAWTNPNDTPDSGRDEDRNGYPDDTFGWNFAEGNNQVIDYAIERYHHFFTGDWRIFQ